MFDMSYIFTNKRIYIFCMFRLTALKSFSRAAVFAIEAIDLRCCSSWNDTLYFPLCLCAHFFATIVTNALSSLKNHSIRIEKNGPNTMKTGPFSIGLPVLKIILDPLSDPLEMIKTFPRPMAKPTRTEITIGTHIGRFTSILSRLLTSPSC